MNRTYILFLFWKIIIRILWTITHILSDKNILNMTISKSLLSNLSLSSHEAESFLNLIKDKKKSILRNPLIWLRYIDDIFLKNTQYFSFSTYIKNTSDNRITASYSDLFLYFDTHGRLYTKHMTIRIIQLPYYQFLLFL